MGSTNLPPCSHDVCGEPGYHWHKAERWAATIRGVG